MGCSYKTCKRRLAEWSELGIWQQIFLRLLTRLRAAGRLGLADVLIDAGLVKAPLGGQKAGPNPTDRGRFGSKYHLMTTLTGIRLAVTLSAANLHDLRQLLPLVFLEFPPISGKPGRPRSVTTDKGYDCQATRELLASVGIETHIPKRGTDDTNQLGRVRWPIERTLSWLKQFRRLRIRWERLLHLREAFLTLGCSLIAWRYLSGQ